MEEKICPYCGEAIKLSQPFVWDDDGDQLHLVCFADMMDDQDFDNEFGAS